MSSTLETSSLLRFCKPISRHAIRSGAYFLGHNQEPRKISLFGSGKISSSSPHVLPSHFTSHIILPGSRCFSVFSAIRISKARYDKLRLDPEALRAHRIKHAESTRRWRKSMSSAQTSHSYLRERLRYWVSSFEWVRDLAWKSHRPVLYHEPVEHQCDRCHLVRRDGPMIWWMNNDALSSKTHADSSKEAQYLCNRCYIDQRPWSAVMPHGYEHVKTKKELIARKKQLDDAANEKGLERDDFVIRRRRINFWCRKYDWIRKLPWPTYQPLFFEQRQGFRCTDCLHAEWSHRCLWWQNEVGSHICNGCYTKPDWSKIMPKGYEDARSMNGLRVRKQQLDELASGHAITSSHTPSPNHRQIGSKLAQATMTRPTSSPPTILKSQTFRKFYSTSVAPNDKEKYSRRRDDPVRWERYLEANRRYRARLRSDDKAYRAQAERNAALSLKQRDEDPTYRERCKLRSKMRYTRVAHQPAYLQSRFIRTLVMSYPWSRAGLPWKSHFPLVSAEPIERHCSGCDVTKIRGSKLWWQKIDAAEAITQSDSQSFLCHSCYFPKKDWACAMPEGYEDVNSIKQLIARKEQIDGSSESGKYTRGEFASRAGAIRDWCQHEFVRLLPWKTHQPVLSKQKVYDRCARCEYARHISLKLW